MVRMVRRHVREDRREHVVGAHPRVEGFGEAVEGRLAAGPLVERRGGDDERLARASLSSSPVRTYP